MSKAFENMDVSEINNALIFLDVDGTLVADNELHPTEDVLKKIHELEKNNVVWLCSNSMNIERNEAIHKLTKVQIIRGHRKPSKKILDYALRERSELADANKERSNNQVNKKDLRRRIVVIGDKVLTDGFFAWRIGGRFIKVKRKIGQDRWFVKIYNLLDDIAYVFLKNFV